MLKCVDQALAIAFLLTSMALAQNPGTPDWASFDKQAEQLYDKGDLKEAIRVARLSVKAASNPKQSGRSLDRLGFLLYTSGNLKEGEAFLRQALALREEKLGVDTLDYAESANDLALFCRDSDKLPEARVLAGHAVAIRSRLLGPSHMPVAESLNTLASIDALAGEYDRAISGFEAALAIHESQPGPKDYSEEYGTLCINLAGTYQRVGQICEVRISISKRTRRPAHQAGSQPPRLFCQPGGVRLSAGGTRPLFRCRKALRGERPPPARAAWRTALLLRDIFEQSRRSLYRVRQPRGGRIRLSEIARSEKKNSRPRCPPRRRLAQKSGPPRLRQTSVGR